MTEEEFQRRMDFIVDQQAHFASDIQQLREVQAQFASDIQQLREEVHQLVGAQAQLVEAQTQTNQVVTRLANVTAEGFKDVIAKIDALVDSQIRLTDDHIRLRDSHIRLTEAQSRTDENLRNLIAIVDRYFREGRDGESGR